MQRSKFIPNNDVVNLPCSMCTQVVYAALLQYTADVQLSYAILNCTNHRTAKLVRDCGSVYFFIKHIVVKAIFKKQKQRDEQEQKSALNASTAQWLLFLL